LGGATPTSWSRSISPSSSSQRENLRTASCRDRAVDASARRRGDPRRTRPRWAGPGRGSGRAPRPRRGTGGHRPIRLDGLRGLPFGPQRQFPRREQQGEVGGRSRATSHTISRHGLARVGVPGRQGTAAGGGAEPDVPEGSGHVSRSPGLRTADTLARRIS
jgi:hypothetical protein